MITTKLKAMVDTQKVKRNLHIPLPRKSNQKEEKERNKGITKQSESNKQNGNKYILI